MPVSILSLTSRSRACRSTRPASRKAARLQGVAMGSPRSRLVGDAEYLLTEVDGWNSGQPAEQVGRLRHGVGVGQHDVVPAAGQVRGNAAMQRPQRPEEDVAAGGEMTLLEPRAQHAAQRLEGIDVDL